jgi:hypothetical protein
MIVLALMIGFPLGFSGLLDRMLLVGRPENAASFSSDPLVLVTSDFDRIPTLQRE